MHLSTLTRSLAGGAVAAIAITAFGAAPAFAGEWTGNDQSLKQDDGTLHGASICAFSGQNDTYSGDPGVPDEDGFTRTQNWGQIDPETRAFLGTIGLHPGDSCKPGAEEPH
jgi:hypothetical protein